MTIDPGTASVVVSLVGVFGVLVALWIQGRKVHGLVNSRYLLALKREARAKLMLAQATGRKIDEIEAELAQKDVEEQSK